MVYGVGVRRFIWWFQGFQRMDWDWVCEGASSSCGFFFFFDVVVVIISEEFIKFIIRSHPFGSSCVGLRLLRWNAIAHL